MEDRRLGVEVVPAREEDLPVVRNMSALYIHDMSEWMGWPCPESGLFGGCDEFFEDWEAGRNHPYLIRVDGELAGFAGVAQIASGSDPEHCIQEFFVLRKFRRRGIGREVATRLFDAHPGRWIVRALASNAPAVAFWRAVIASYAHGSAETAECLSQWGMQKTIRFRSR